MLRRVRLLVVLLLAVPAAALAQFAYTTATVDLRAGPDGLYPLVLRVYPGTQVQVHGCIANWSWCDVTVGFERGWMYAAYLAYPYQGSNVTIYGYGPTLGLPILSFGIAPYWDRYYRSRPWWHQRNEWYYRPLPAPRPPPPGYRPPSYPPHGGRPPPGGARPPPGTRPPPPPGGSRPPPPGGGQPPPPGGSRPPPGGGGGGPPPRAMPMPKPQPVPPPTSAPPGPAPTPR